jgi:hypothetical protein
MLIKFRIIQIAVISILFTSCASVYHVISPSTINYNSSSIDSITLNKNQSILVEYQGNLLSGKYAKRAVKSGVNLIAVKITNNTTHDIIPKSNIKIFSGENEVVPISLENFFEATKQNPDKSMRFLFLVPLNVYSFSQTTDGDQVTSSKHGFYPIGIILGPALAFGNKAVAKSANKKFKKELDENNIIEKIIRPRETAFGFIAIDGNFLNNLTFKTL